MSKQWLTTNELLKKLNLKDFELLDLIKKGLQPYSQFRKEPIPCPPEHHLTSILDSIIIQYSDALEKFEMFNGESLCEAAWELKLLDIKYDEWGNLKLIQTTPLKALVENIHQELEYEDNDPEWREILSDSLQNQREKGSNGIHEGFFNLIHARQNYLILRKLKEIVKEKASKIRMEGREVRIRDRRQQNWSFFILPIDELEVQKTLDTIREAVFRADEIREYESKFRTPSAVDHNEKSKKEKAENDDVVDTFVKNLRIYYENDNEIKIQVPKKKAITVTCDTLGFRDNQTLGWKTFMEILQDPDHLYDLGPSYTISAGINTQNKEYQQKRKRLDQISLKLVKHFNKEYREDIPEKYKLFELAKDRGTGKYKPKFNSATNPNREKSPLENKYERFSKDELINKIEEIVKEYSDSQDDAFMEKITVASKVALEKKWLTNLEIEDLIKKKSDKKVIQESFSDVKYDENEVDRIKGH